MTEVPRDIDDDLREADAAIAAETSTDAADPWRVIKQLQAAQAGTIIEAGKRLLTKAEAAVDSDHIDQATAYRELAIAWNRLGAY